MFKQFLGDHMKKDRKDKFSMKVEVITGKGLHSESGVPVLRPVVLQTFEEEFSPSIACSIDENNSGQVVLSASEIWKWMNAQISEAM